MVYITMFISLMVLVQSFRVSLRYLKKDFNKYKLIKESIIFFTMIILCYFVYNHYLLITYITFILSIIILIIFIHEMINRGGEISVLSIKDAIDMSTSGILFLDNKNEILLTNEVMNNILTKLNIHEDYINELNKKCFKYLKYSSLLRIDDYIYQLKINSDKEIILLNITDIYKLQEEEEKQNKKIEKNNKKLLNTIDNIEKVEKERSLLRIKNEYHDLLGYKLAVFSKYMEQKEIKKQDIIYLLDNINEGKYLNTNSLEKIYDLIKIYKIIGVNINVYGSFPSDLKVVEVLFEIIREAITNAIIHGNSKNIDITIKNKTIIIENDGEKHTGYIQENEGMKGMRRKLKSIKGKLTVDNSDKFKLIINI